MRRYQRKVLIVTYASGRTERLRCNDAGEERSKRETLRGLSTVASITEEVLRK